ncbi:hypothetical protein CN689_22405 [Peribacillus butanolivorans]|uniref:Uncharacterized protein n=1 Tax=Peribacillus butanolivorans TaxID=421767 RepID=A0AAX0RQR5_9BACI|nr:hypothetical protein CN689_22405 [Peribacillus butanolivorans]
MDFFNFRLKKLYMITQTTMKSIQLLFSRSQKYLKISERSKMIFVILQTLQTGVSNQKYPVRKSLLLRTVATVVDFK